MKVMNLVSDLIKAWGVQKVCEALVSTLRKMGHKEAALAEDIEDALERYNR